jgi:thiosulfate/3-mercaptopyruvate sulfurtransferase
MLDMTDSLPVDPLVDVASLATTMDTDEPPILLDVRWKLGGPPGLGLFRAGHLPGARYVDLDAELAAPPGAGGRHPLPDPAEFGAAMRRHGVSAARQVVVYDDGDAISASRAWWLLRHAGHPRVSVLDGGFAAWREAGGHVEQGDAPRPEPGDFEARDYLAGEGAMPVLNAESAAALAHAGVLLDARSAARYRGEIEPIDAVAGHIPGAVSAPTTGNMLPDGRFVDAETLRARFAALGARAGTPVGVYCGSGITAAHEVIALARAGVEAALYPGSWSEWITDPSRPIAVS